jgi:hypothetical protein
VGIEDKFIDLLTWIKERNLEPRVPSRNDRYLCLFTKKMIPFDRLKPHQRRTSLWIPTARGLNQRGFRVETRNLGHLVVAKSHRFMGAGAGESEAVLSLLNRIRLARAS